MSLPEPLARGSFRRLFPIALPKPLGQLPTRSWSQSQWERIQLGYHARGMDEKWNVLTEGQTVFLHRSWTGRGIYAATFTGSGDGWRVESAVVESDPRHHRVRGDEFDSVMLELVLSSIVLGEPATELRRRFVAVARQGVPEGDPSLAGAVEHSAVGLRSGS